MENKFLDRDGLKVIWREISLQDYPNNETLMAVIEAIDETKADKNEIENNYYSKTETDNLLNTKANSDHNHDSSDIVSGTLSVDRLPIVPIEKGGTGCTTIEDTIYTTARYRASSLNPTETTPTINGVIAWYYE